MPEHLCSLKMGCVYLWLHFRCVGREKWVISNCSLTLFIPWPQENNLFITSACSEDVMQWLSSSLYIYIYIFSPPKKWGQEDCPFEPPLCQRTSRDFQHVEEDQKVSGTFAKRLKSQTLPTLPLGLVNSYQGFRGGGSRLPTSAKKANEAWERKTNIRKHRAPIKHQSFCLWPSKRLRFVGRGCRGQQLLAWSLSWKWRFISVYALQKLLGGDPEVKGNTWGQIFKTLDLLEFCLESLVPFIQPAGSLHG